MNVLAVGCHPDDVEIGCSGTLLKCAQRGDKVFVCHVANGNMGHVIIEPDELREMRIAEAQKAAKMGGFEIITLDVGDLLPNAADVKQRDAMIEVVRYAQPDLIITHAPQDYMTDHQEVSKLVYHASFACSCPHYGHEEVHTVPPLDAASLPLSAEIAPLYYMDTLAGVNFVPTEYVDITDVIDKKLEMLECHESQLKWMRDHDHIDFADFVKTCSKYRGLQCGVGFAEGFIHENCWPRVKPYRLLP